MATSDRARLMAAIAKYAPSVDAMARKRYGISGTALLAKTLQGESSALTDPTKARDADSGKAHGWAQATPGSRRISIQKYGVDPNRSPEDAVHFMSLHLRGKINGSSGLEGYNPGDPDYPDYILKQKVGNIHGQIGGGGATTGAATAAAPAGVTAATGDPLDAAFDAGRSSGLSNLLAGVAQQQAPVVSGSLPQMPDFAAAPPVPAGYQAPVSGGGPQPSQQEVALPAQSDLSLPQVQVQEAPAPAATSGGRVSGIQQTASAIVDEALQRAETLDARHLPYLWGGGHGGKVDDVSKTGPLDCSGAVSAVLGIDPRVSGEFEKFGSPGKTKAKSGINVYANGEHVLMSIVVGGKERFFGTSRSNPGGGAGWIPASQLSSEYLSRFTVRHLARANA